MKRCIVLNLLSAELKVTRRRVFREWWEKFLEELWSEKVLGAECQNPTATS